MATAADPQQEIARLRNEVHAKDETLTQLKAKTKAFVDNMRHELSVEKQKVTSLENQLKDAQQQQNASGEAEALKREIGVATQREAELKARAKTFADSMKAQLQAEKDKAAQLEKELHEKQATLDKVASSAALEQASASSHEQELTTLRVQLQTATQDLGAMGERLRTMEVKAAERAHDAITSRDQLETLRTSSEQEIARLQKELNDHESHEKALETSLWTSQSSTQAALSVEHAHLAETESKNQELVLQIQQYKIENEHLQKQLVDKDFQLEQLESYRLRAEESDAQVQTLRVDLTTITVQLQAKTEEYSAQISKCEGLQQELSEMTTLYEKVNMGRSQSDAQLAEAQSIVTSLESLKQRFNTSQQELEASKTQVLQLQEKIDCKETEIVNLQADFERLGSSLATAQQQLIASKSDSQRRLNEVTKAEMDKSEELCSQLQSQLAQVEKKNQELAASIDAVNKENNDKRQKAKALVMSLTSEKQTLVDAKASLQKEVDRLRMELNQRNVENEKRIKQMNDEASQKVSQSATNLQHLTDEIATLKQTLAIVQESEKNQQRAKELANAKREIEDSNKKRLAAKAETQKLAVELETVQKVLAHLTEHTNSNCNTSIRKMAMLQERVQEALHLLEKRAAASASARGKKLSSAASPAQDIEVEDLRGPETASSSSSREKAMSPTQGAKKVEEQVTRVTERVCLSWMSNCDGD